MNKSVMHVLLWALSYSLMMGCAKARLAQNTKGNMNTSAYKYETKRLALSSGIELAYRDSGSGPETLLMIHGLGSYLPVWDKMTPLLEERFRCVRLDLPGYGNSSPVPTPVSISFFAAQVEAFAKKLKLKKIILVGHSMGGQIAIRICLNKRLDIEKLILLAPAGIEKFNKKDAEILKSWVTPASVLAQTESQTAHNFAVNFYGNQLPADARFMLEDREELKKDSSAYTYFAQLFPSSMMAMLEGPVYAKLPDLRLPVLVLFGEDDQLIPNRFLHPNMSIQEVANMARKEIPQASVELLQECGHFVPWDRAATVSRKILEFTTTTKVYTP